jgi:hypothetical protein
LERIFNDFVPAKMSVEKVPFWEFANSMWRQLTTVMVSLWLGAFTFYAAVVVPLGSGVLGSWSQGLVTQQVAVAINCWSLFVTVILFVDLKRRSGALRLSGSCAFGIATLSLFVLHWLLSGQLGGDELADHQPSEFYEWHRIYLILSALQWTIAVVMTWLLIKEAETSGLESWRKLP